MPTPPTIVAISLKMYFSCARALEYSKQLATFAMEDEGVRGGAADLANHNHGVSIRIFIKSIQDFDKVQTLNRVAAKTYAGGLAQTGQG